MNKYLKNKKYNKSAGFTLIETLVAIFVFMTAIVGPLTIVSKGVFFSNIAKDEITAFYLAQEAIEHIANKRNNNTIAGGDWNTFKQNIISSCFDPGSCKVDVPGDTISACSGGDCGFINQNSVTHLYGYQTGGNWSPSPFRRTVKIYNEPASDVNANEIRIEVTMNWQNGVLTKNFIIKDNLFNWQ